MKMNRREFLIRGAAGATACAMGGCMTESVPPPGRFHLALAGYTLNKFKTDEALAFCEKHGFRALCVKDFHLPFTATAAQIAEFRRKCADHGVTPYGVGPIKITRPDEIGRYFDYAAALGVPLMVAVPGIQEGPGWKNVRSDRKMCELCSVKADEYKIRLAIHNHGRNPKTGNPRLYPAVPEIHELIKDLSPRMGFCVDWSYTYADGLDCVAIARTHRARIFDGHVRCLLDPKNGSSGTNPATRSFDYAPIFNALREIGYDGYLGLELANAFPKNPQWIDESRAYFEGLIGAV